jgi:hypothetical protein
MRTGNADAVASAATDGSSERRKFHTNLEKVLLRPNAWVAIISANPTSGNDAGVADRLLPLRTERQGEETGDDVFTVATFCPWDQKRPEQLQDRRLHRISLTWAISLNLNPNLCRIGSSHATNAGDA